MQFWSGLCVLAFILSLNTAQGQPNSYKNAEFIANVPFKIMTGGVVLLRGTFNDYPDSLNFILDTGSGGISLDSTTCSKLRIPLDGSTKTIKGIAGRRTVPLIKNASLKLPGLKTDSLTFHVNDYELLTSVYGVHIDGIVGFSFLTRYIVRMNYDSLRMEVFTNGNFKYPKAGWLWFPRLGSIPIQEALINDDHKIRQKYYFDTGAGLCVLLSSSFVTDSMVLRPDKPAPVLTQGEGLGGKLKMKLTTLKSIKIGPYRFRKVPTLIFDDEFNVTVYPELGGLIGNDIYRRFNITLNYLKNEIHIIPNSHFYEEFDYSYTGLGIYQVDDRIMVEEIAEGSPADKAGFKIGDVLIAVNNDASGDIQAYKYQMQELNKRSRFIVYREGELKEIRMKPRNILR